MVTKKYAIIQKIPNKNTARGYTIISYPGGKIVSNHNKLTIAKAKAKEYQTKSKLKYFVVTADIYETRLVINK